jgi:hypothetical protein
MKCTKKLLALLFVVSIPTLAGAHTPNVAMESAPAGNVAWFYLTLGFEHIIPDGFDHILFVVGLCLLNTKLKSILWQATAFTVAHSITLALSMKSVVTLPAEIVEPLIALSIAFIAFENLLTRELKPWRIAVVFLFGLIHGLGFASSLNEIGLPRNRFLTSILSFNVGVELGQIAVILLVYLLLILPFGQKDNYRKWVVYPLSVVIGLVALWWVWERMG